MDDEGKLPRRDCSGDALLQAAFPEMLLTDPHTGSCPSNAPQTQVPRGALAKVTPSKTSVTHGCCLWQPVATMGMCLIAIRRGQRCGMCSCKPRALCGPWELSSLAQSSIPPGKHGLLSSCAGPSSHQPVSKSQSILSISCFF